MENNTQHTVIIGEIGINHNGDINVAKKLIYAIKDAGGDLVKFQKRTIDLVYDKEELDKYRESPWGTTNREQKYGLEFTKKEYDIIDQYCRDIGIDWMASSWDIESQYFLRQYNLKYNKIASALLTNKDLLSLVAEEKKYTFISTGMSTLEQIQEAINIFKNKKCEFELMHCNSTYPMKNEEANLKVIETLRKKFKCKVGYSDHSAGRIVSLAAVAIGATSVERHVTLDKAMYGSDQPASLETLDFKKLVIDIRQIEKAFGSSVKRIMDSEIPIMKKLRRV